MKAILDGIVNGIMILIIMAVLFVFILYVCFG